MTVMLHYEISTHTDSAQPRILTLYVPDPLFVREAREGLGMRFGKCFVILKWLNLRCLYTVTLYHHRMIQIQALSFSLQMMPVFMFYWESLAANYNKVRLPSPLPHMHSEGRSDDLCTYIHVSASLQSLLPDLFISFLQSKLQRRVPEHSNHL